MLVTERQGRVRVVRNGQLQREPLFTVPDVEQSGESGLMDLSLHPQFATNHYLYLCYAYKGDGQRVKVVRYTEDGQSLKQDKVIVENIPAAQSRGLSRTFWSGWKTLRHDRRRN
jgi:glucose/arabinose dehydrogenase